MHQGLLFLLRRSANCHLERRMPVLDSLKQLAMVTVVSVELRRVLDRREEVQVVATSKEAQHEVSLVVSAVVLSVITLGKDDAFLNAADGSLCCTDIHDTSCLQRHGVRGEHTLLMKQHGLKAELLK